jgi:hypothetical protein
MTIVPGALRSVPFGPTITEIEKGEFCAKTLPAQKARMASADVAKP